MRTVTVGGFTFGSPPVTDGAGCRWTLTGPGISGWDDSGSGVRRESPDRPQAHGAFGGPGFRTGRSAAFAGLIECPTRAAAAGVKTALAALLADGSDGDLTVVDSDEPTMSVTVGLASKPVIDWNSGLEIECAFELWAPDPLRYAAPVSVWTLFPTPRGGLEYDLYTDGAGADLGYLDYGLASDTGRLVVTNTGTAPAPVLFQVEGDVAPEGFDIAQVDSDRRLRFVGPNSASSVLVLDGATGNVLVDGTADRGGQLTHRDWPVVPAATRVAGVLVPGSIELAFINLGATSSARLTAVIRPGSW